VKSTSGLHTHMAFPVCLEEVCWKKRVRKCLQYHCSIRLTGGGLEHMSFPVWRPHSSYWYAAFIVEGWCLSWFHGWGPDRGWTQSSLSDCVVIVLFHEACIRGICVSFCDNGKITPTLTSSQICIHSTMN